VYLNLTAHHPYSTADLHSRRCAHPDRLRRFMQDDQHASFTGTKWPKTKAS
jgi:hypothetical protein